MNEQALALKAQGSQAFAAANYALAETLYTQALLAQFKDQPLDFLPEDRAALHANRSASLQALGRFAAALDEAGTQLLASPRTYLTLTRRSCPGSRTGMPPAPSMVQGALPTRPGFGEHAAAGRGRGRV